MSSSLANIKSYIISVTLALNLGNNSRGTDQRKGRLQRGGETSRLRNTQKNSNLTFKYGSIPKETTNRIYCSDRVITQYTNAKRCLLKCKASEAVHNSFWTLKQGHIWKS